MNGGEGKGDGKAEKTYKNIHGCLLIKLASNWKNLNTHQHNSEELYSSHTTEYTQ